jgi:hypothetical protein
MGTRKTFVNGLRRCGSITLPGTSCCRGGFAGLVLGLAVMLVGPVATASAEAPCGNEQFRVGVSAALPDCRAYELVSPADKNGGNVFFPANIMNVPTEPIYTGPAADGEQLMYWSFNAFAGAQDGAYSAYVATRGPTGWASVGVSPRPPVTHPALGNAVFNITDVNANFSSMVVSSLMVLDPAEQPASAEGTPNLYVREPDGSFTWISRGNGELPQPGGGEGYSYAGGSSDDSQVVFQTTAKLVGADSGQEYGYALYKYVNGHNELVNVNDAGELLNKCGAEVGGWNETYRAVSEDGSRIYFTTPTSGNNGNASCEVPAQVDLREGGQTIQISESQRTVPDPAGTQPAYFQGASKDGSRAFFTSTQALTNEAQPGSSSSELLYEYDATTGHLKLLTPNDGGQSPDVTGVAAVSADGSHVYFVNEVGGEPWLEMYTEGNITPIAALPVPSIGPYGEPISLAGHPEGFREVRLSPNGLYLAFGYRGNLTSFDSQEHQEIYLYDASSSALRCVSCNSNGHVPLGEAYFSSDPNTPSALSYPLSENVTDEGSVFFETKDSLVPRDTNGVMDVYEWGGGEDHLISDGEGSGPSYFVGSVQEGRDVFFSTYNSLIPQDTDGGSIDIYDARVGGGFAAPAESTAGCSGEACQGALSSAPTLAAIGSATPQGQGNLAPAPKPKAKPKPKGKSKCKARPKRKCKSKHRAKSAKKGDSAVNHHGKSRSAGR